MAELHNALRRASFLKAIKNALGVQDATAGVERFGETLTPTINIWSMPEWASLRSDMYAGITGTQAATAAEFSCIALINPAGSNLIAVVEGISAVTLTTNSGCLLEVTTEAVIRAALAGVETRGLYRDRRRTAVSARCSSLVGTEATSVGGEIEQMFPPGAGVSAPFVTALPLILPPGQGVVVRVGTVNIAGRASFGWRERVVQAGELV